MKNLSDDASLQFILTLILHLNLKRVIIEKELRLEANTWSISIKSSELKLPI